ncbi:class I SAM-dependent methyltransferase [Geobacter sp. SVR]|uniref:class I SAM-dependent methyltransferase n=1 Tax=Geobacter sp. SVR TaxID=2495594 RepID=UPI00143F01DF|nr:SAM-dependent methyltransferase [Geobacter sp. SVR]BCS52158.1 SAM-dependent methyltransferase [Geobacter sp. SVR]GCF86613.1 SAM-dependent methyltransferase [Geobacter sp. SVR]
MTDTTQLTDIITARIADQGRITFAAFMEACLYEPGLGYYTSPGRKVGAEGDFYTSISVHAAFGRVIAREIAQMWRSMGTPEEFTLVECGAGNGRLACDIMGYLAERESDLYRVLNLVLVEREPSLEAAQAGLLEAHRQRVSWLTPEALTSGSFTFSGCLYSNELIDAMPVHRVVMTEEGLQEIYVAMREGMLAEEAGPLSTPEIAGYLERIGIELHPGKEAEINLAGLGWLATAARALRQGFILTVDYGFPAKELFAPHRNRGTLLCYHRHTIEDNPYIRLGQQDITSHVDFTSLIRRGEELGLQEVWFGEQYRFLISSGIIEELEDLERSDRSEEEKLRVRLALKKLIMPEGGMGDTFRVLIQSKGVETPRLRCQRGIGG